MAGDHKPQLPQCRWITNPVCPNDGGSQILVAPMGSHHKSLSPGPSRANKTCPRVAVARDKRWNNSFLKPQTGAHTRKYQPAHLLGLCSSPSSPKPHPLLVLRCPVVMFANHHVHQNTAGRQGAITNCGTHCTGRVRQWLFYVFLVFWQTKCPRTRTQLTAAILSFGATWFSLDSFSFRPFPRCVSLIPLLASQLCARGCRIFNSGGEVDRAPPNWGWGVWGKGSTDRTISQL